MKKLLAFALSMYAMSATAAIVEFVPPNDQTGQVYSTNTNDGWSTGRGVVFQATSDTTIDMIGVYHDLTGIDLSYKLSQTTSASGDVESGETILASGAANLTNSGLEWNDFQITNTPLVSGNYYHIEFLFAGSGNQNFFYNNGNVVFTQGDFDIIDGTASGNTSNFVMPAIRLNTSGDDVSNVNTHTFATSMEMLGGGADAPDVTLSCNNGLPLEQTAPIGTTFTVTLLTDGAICTISLAEELPPGFMISDYLSGPVGGENVHGTDQCFFSITPGTTEWGCIMTMAVGQFSYDVTVTWDIAESGNPVHGAGTNVELVCLNVWDDNASSLTDIQTSADASPGASMPVSLDGYAPDPDGSTTCNAYLIDAPSNVDSDNSECDVAVKPGDTEVPCTIYASVFFEGIPTLSQYGMAILALLMLGVGFVGFRRLI